MERMGRASVKSVAVGVVVLILGAGLSGGCAHRMSQDELDRAVDELVRASPYGIAPDQDVLEVSDEMRELLDRKLNHVFNPWRRVQMLADLFKTHGDLRLSYDQTVTYTAQDTFEQQIGNCLSFTQLYIAMAREVGIYVRFREAWHPSNWTRIGDTPVLNQHVTVWGTTGDKTFEVDFGRLEREPINMHNIISDERARAQFFNNLGGEAIVRGDLEAAMPNINRALLLDPTLALAWSNLGTALRHLGSDKEAERAYVWALRLEPDTVPAMGGLASIYRVRGDLVEAQRWTEAMENHDLRNPYRYLFRGKQALANQDPQAAVKLLKDAIKLKGEEPDFHFTLGLAYLELGDVRAARSRFKRTEELTRDSDQARIYGARLLEVLDGRQLD